MAANEKLAFGLMTAVFKSILGICLIVLGILFMEFPVYFV